MSLVHMGVALGLSAGAALLVTGAAMRPIDPGMAASCATGAASCARADDVLTAGNAPGGSSLRLDSDQPDHDRRFYRLRGPYSDCHRDVRRHYVPGYGVISHLHVGPDCKFRKAYKSGSG